MRIVLPVLAALLASASARADDVDLDIRTTAQEGEGLPSIVLTSHKDVKTLELELASDGGQRITEKKGPIEKEKTLTFELAQKPGKVHWEGRLVVRFETGKGLAYPLSFDAELGRPLLMTFPPEPLDAAHDAVRFQLNRSEVEVKVVALDLAGKVIGEGKASFSKEPPGRVLSASWKPARKAEVAQVNLDAVDPAGFSSHGEVVTWKVELPHAEVNFDTAKHDLKPSEEPKLAAVLPELKEALERAKRFPGVRFWIAGHTDTVDDRAYNQALSERRARTIATWFRQHGVTIPISYAGFGEMALLVPTPDDTPEVKNRRATYILSVEVPSRDVTWTPLQ